MFFMLATATDSNSHVLNSALNSGFVFLN